MLSKGDKAGQGKSVCSSTNILPDFMQQVNITTMPPTDREFIANNDDQTPGMRSDMQFYDDLSPIIRQGTTHSRQRSRDESSTFSNSLDKKNKKRNYQVTA